MPGTVLDGGWGWAVVVAASLNMFFCMGLTRSGGLIYVSSLEVFQTTRTLAAWIPMVTSTISYLAAPFATALAKRYSFHLVVSIGGLVSLIGMLICFFATNIVWLFLGWGCVFGLGCGLVMFPSMASIGVYFRKRRALGTGLMLACGPIGVFCLPPLLGFLIQNYTLKGATLITGGLMMHSLVSASLFKLVSSIVKRKVRPPAPRNNSTVIEDEASVLLKKDDEEADSAAASGQKPAPASPAVHRNVQPVRVFNKSTIRQLLHNRTFLINCIGNSIQTSILFGVNTLVPDFAEGDIGATRLEGAYIISVTAISDVTCKLIFGWIMSKRTVNITYATLGMLCAYFLSVLALVFVLKYSLVMACAVVFGASFGCGLVLYFEVLASCVPRETYVMAVGFSSVIKAPFLIAVAATLGSLKDATGSYSLTFLVFTMVLVIPLLLWICEARLQRRTEKKQLEPLI